MIIVENAGESGVCEEAWKEEPFGFNIKMQNVETGFQTFSYWLDTYVWCMGLQSKG